MLLLDVASRIASGLSYSQMRLHDLVKAYGAQLRGLLHREDPKEYQAFKDTNSIEVYKAIHALFWEMAVLSDTLAEFAAAFCFFRPGVRKLSRLCKFLKEKPPHDALCEEFLRITDQTSNGWLATFINYRNFFTHTAPLEQATNIAFAVQDLRKLPCGLSIPQLYYALPQEAAEFTSKRSQGIFFNSWKELSAASSRRHERASEHDALEYLHGCINQFAGLSLELVARSPISPKPIRIGPEDMIGEIKVS